jgi:hypothetical protein
MHESGPVAGEKGGVLGVSILTRGHCFLADPPNPQPSWRAVSSSPHPAERPSPRPTPSRNFPSFRAETRSVTLPILKIGRSREF